MAKKVEERETSVEIHCPECNCEYFLPMMKCLYVKGFDGNRAQMAWPTREKTGDTFVAGCPACGIMYRVDEEGKTVKLNRGWKKIK